MYLEILFSLFLGKKKTILRFEEWSGASSQDNKDLVTVILGLAAQTGTTLEVFRLFLEEEFKRNSQKDETNQNTIMRGSSLIAKLIKSYLGNLAYPQRKRESFGIWTSPIDTFLYLLAHHDGFKKNLSILPKISYPFLTLSQNK